MILLIIPIVFSTFPIVECFNQQPSSNGKWFSNELSCHPTLHCVKPFVVPIVLHMWFVILSISYVIVICIISFPFPFAINPR